MKYENGDTIRYVQVVFAFEQPLWYIDPNDEVEAGDWVIAPFQHREREGEVKTVVRCVYPYVVFSERRTKEIFEITKRVEQVRTAHL